MTELQKMVSGKLYDSTDAELRHISAIAHGLCLKYNNTFEEEIQKRQEIIDELIPNKGTGVYLQGPIYFDYGCFTILGNNFYANFNLTVLDSCPVKIGDNVMIGPNCSLLTAVHPMRYQDRNMRIKEDGSLFDYEYAKPITIGSNCWLGGNVTVIGGVSIGEGCVIGAGSVAIKDIPENCFAAGNPCRVIRPITDADRIELKPELF